MRPVCSSPVKVQVAPAVGRLVDPLPHRDVAADLPFARSRPDNVRIGRRDTQRPDRLHGLIVEDGVPVHAAVGGLVDAARCGADIVGVGVAGDAGGSREAVAFRADVAPLEGGVGGGVGLLGGGGVGGGRRVVRRRRVRGRVGWDRMGRVRISDWLGWFGGWRSGYAWSRDRVRWAGGSVKWGGSCREGVRQASRLGPRERM